MPKCVRIVVVTVIGGVFLIAGLVMMVTPGPALLFIPLGLLLLAGEFKCAEKWMQALMNAFDKARAKWRAYRKRRAAATRSDS
jgi:tellurite resistance protein TerC